MYAFKRLFAQIMKLLTNYKTFVKGIFVQIKIVSNVLQTTFALSVDKNGL